MLTTRQQQRLSNWFMEEETEIPEMPTFGRYAEIPYDEMTPEQQEAYRSVTVPRTTVE